MFTLNHPSIFTELVNMFNEQEKIEITIEGIQNGDIFMKDGIAVDEYGDPIFEEDTND